MKLTNRNKCIISLFIVFVIMITSVMAFDVGKGAAKSKKISNIKLKIGGTAVTKKTYSLVKGKKATVKVQVTPQKAKKKVTFKSSNKKAVTVSQKGIVKAHKKGTAKVTIVVKGKNIKAKSTWVKIKVTNKAKTGKTPTSSASPVKVTELTIADGESKIYGKLYSPEKEGIYPAVILSHGYNGTNADFVNECNYFAQNGYIAYAYDFCGGSTRSKSTGKSTDMTIFTEKSNLMAVYNHIKGMANVDAGRVFLFGGSQGGLVTALTTEELPEGVKGMILYFPALNIPDDWRKKYPSMNDIPNKLNFWGLELGKVFFTSIHDFNTFDHIGAYSRNVLIIYGNKDAIVPYSYMTKAKEIYKNAELIVLPNEGHGFSPAGGKRAREEVLKFMQKQ